MLHGPAFLLAHLQGNSSNRSLYCRAFSRMGLWGVMIWAQAVTAVVSPLFELAVNWFPAWKWDLGMDLTEQPVVRSFSLR